jgi:hypothetical protein
LFLLLLASFSILPSEVLGWPSLLRAVLGNLTVVVFSALSLRPLCRAA